MDDASGRAIFASADVALIQINARASELYVIFHSYTEGKCQMTTETMLAIIAISIPFILFAGALFWADRQTRTRG